MANGGPTDELLRRLLAAVASDASGDDITHLLADARAEAEAEVKALIKASYKASLLRAATEQLERSRRGDEPPAAPSVREVPLDAMDRAEVEDVAPSSPVSSARFEEETRAEGHAPDADHDVDSTSPSPTAGCYVYAVTSAATHDWAAVERGIDPHCPLDVVAHEDVRAIVSDVSLAEFGQDAISERVSDARWVEDKVRAHDGVVRRAMSAADAVIPCRFCTVVRDRADVQRLLAERHGDIAASLADLRGKQEWGVKGYVNLSALSRQIDEEASATENSGGSSGADYLRRRQRADTTRVDAERRARAYADECHIALAAAASDAARIARRVRAGNGANAGVEPVLNGAYLVAERDATRFHEALNALAERFRPMGMTFEMTGPWPAYNFVRLDLSLQAVA